MSERRLTDIPAFRFVFSNEPVERLATLGDRVRAALAAAGWRE